MKTKIQGSQGFIYSSVRTRKALRTSLPSLAAASATQGRSKALQASKYHQAAAHQRTGKVSSISTLSTRPAVSDAHHFIKLYIVHDIA